MAHELFVVALSLSAALPLPAGNAGAGAPEGTPETRYCLRVDPVIGSRIETIQCRTREGWADLDVNVDEEWAANGVRVIA
jgi:hypothetical protein